MGGKALLIKGVDFGSQKLTTVNYTEGVPCTGLSLNETTKSMTAVGSTFTLIPTKVPLNTTDTVYWATSNANIATVSDGVATQIGVGTVAITATCGNQTATCTITATNVLTYETKAGEVAIPGLGAKDYVDVGTSGGGEHYGCMVNSSVPTTRWLRKAENSSFTGTLYPILLGNGATTITASVPSDCRLTIFYVNSEESCTYSADHSSFAKYARFVSGDASQYDSNVPLGDRTATIPSGVDSAVFDLHKPGTGNTVTTEDLAAVVITVS